jgi:hypothetical protein
MGTRSITKIYDGTMLLVTIYRQYDGYMAGHGKDLAAILEGKTIVNGLPGSADTSKLFNGAGCMAASIIAGLKTGAGGIYIQAASDLDDNMVDYVYKVRTGLQGVGWDAKPTAPTITVTSYGRTVFEGSVEEFCDATVYESEID